MWSSSPVCARPVLTLPRSVFRASTDFCIFCSAAFFTSAIIGSSLPNRLHAASVLLRESAIARSVRSCSGTARTTVLAMHQRAFVLAHYHALERTRREDAEYLEQHVLVAAERKRGGVHHLQVLDDRLVESQCRIAPRRLVLVRIRSVDAVDLGSLEHDVDTHLAAAQCGCGIGGEERVSGACSEDDDLVFFQIAQSLAADVRLGYLFDRQRRLHARNKP